MNTETTLPLSPLGSPSCSALLDLRLGDCMEIMATFPDGHFDLAIVDPPYGINAGAVKKYCSKNAKTYSPKPWDSKTPDQGYFDEGLHRKEKAFVPG